MSTFSLVFQVDLSVLLRSYVNRRHCGRFMLVMQIPSAKGHSLINYALYRWFSPDVTAAMLVNMAVSSRD